jgi:O-antigen/teichoic acid export membrane protein
LSTFTVLYTLHIPELWVALVSLLVIALYGILLYLFRNRLQRKFSFQIKKNSPLPLSQSN